MKNDSFKTDNHYEPVINDIFLKHQSEQDNLVLETNINNTRTLEDVLLGLSTIKDMAESELGPFDNIDIRVH